MSIKNRFTQHSIERQLLIFMLLVSALCTLLLTAWLQLSEASGLLMISCYSLLWSVMAWLYNRVYQAIVLPLQTLSTTLEAVRQEDYSMHIKTPYQKGSFAAMSREIATLSGDLQQRKSQYDQQAVLVLRLIEQLASPLAIFDAEQKLYHGNDALSQWCRRPWRQLVHQPASKLGLQCSERENQIHWQCSQPEQRNKWQLRHSQFIMNDTPYQLLVLTNIEQVVQHTEQRAFHKMTRVLSHEINNSLAPINSLAQSLSEILAADHSMQDPLQVIIARSQSLMTFVNRYANLNQVYEVNLTSLNLTECINNALALLELKVDVDLNTDCVHADKVLLEQVLINLLKNAKEASPKAAEIRIESQASDNATTIRIIDSGTGIANPENLFVPFYTTKTNGKGIGLSLCRNMLEQQGGRLSLTNRNRGQGAIASIVLANS